MDRRASEGSAIRLEPALLLSHVVPLPLKLCLQVLIDDENPDAILSDDKLVSLLKTDGVDIARRTVAKYREAMKIPSSVQRRREKKRLVALT